MSFSFIVIDKQNKLNLNEFISYTNAYSQKYEIIYCSSIKNNDERIRNFVFSEHENTEKILNTVIEKCENNNIIIIRDINRPHISRCFIPVVQFYDLKIL